MKKFISNHYPQPGLILVQVIAMLILFTTGMHAQEETSVNGTLVDKSNRQPIAFASLILRRASDSAAIQGAISDDNGMFSIHPVSAGSYRLYVSLIGYVPVARSIEVNHNGAITADTIYLEEKEAVINNVVVVGERIRAKTEKDKTTFFVTKKIMDASMSGIDVLKNIPGIRIDFLQNISLEGSANIQILVDGRERDRNFLNQLTPAQIEKVEVISNPSSNYDGNVTGAINIILKKERNGGFNCQFLAEIPAFSPSVFIHPTFSMNYSYRKWNIYTSYQGEMIYLNVHEYLSRRTWNRQDTNEFLSEQFVRQKDWSHRLNYGFDYILNEQNQFSFYAFFNPYSQEHDGTAQARVSGTLNDFWKTRKEDADRNLNAYYSLFFKHSFGKTGRQITVDISNYNLNGKSTTRFYDEGNTNSALLQSNQTKPLNNEITLKSDFSSPLGDKIALTSGIKARHRMMKDGSVPGFRYTEKLLAAYSTLGLKQIRYDIDLGLRVEESRSALEHAFNNNILSFFPYLSFAYRFGSNRSMHLSYNRSVRRPDLFQLNPNIYIIDPYTVSKGNPYLKPEFRNSATIDYSRQFKSNYFAIRLFYNEINHTMSNLTFLNDTSAFETDRQNLGTISQAGFQFSGTLKLGIATLSPYLQLYRLSTAGNELAKQYQVKNKNVWGFESGLSAILSFRYDISFSVNFQYSSPKNSLQDNSYCDALYFISLEKGIGKRFKAGMMTAMPFTKSFIYQGSDISSAGFDSHYKGIVDLSTPFWFKLSYQFSSGKSRNKINHEPEDINEIPKKGF